MIFDISTEAYDLSGLGNCCVSVEQIQQSYCGAEFFDDGFGGFCLLNNFIGVSGSEVLHATAGLDCAISGITPTSQADCNNINGTGGNATFVPTTPYFTYVSSGNCLLKVTSDSSCGCPNSIQTTQSIDLCDLAASAFNQLNPDALNLFDAPCV